MQLEQQDIEQFRASGYLIVRGLFRGRELADLIHWTDEVEAWPETPGRAMKYFETSRGDGSRLPQRIENFYPFHDGFSYAPHRSAPNNTAKPRRVLYINYNRASDGDWREQYYADKRRSFPPDCEREAGKVDEYKV